MPCLVLDVDMEESGLLAMVENLQREDLDFVEEARGISNLIRMFDMSQEEAARRLGLSQSAVANKLRLLKLPPDILAALQRQRPDGEAWQGASPSRARRRNSAPPSPPSATRASTSPRPTPT